MIYVTSRIRTETLKDGLYSIRTLTEQESWEILSSTVTTVIDTIQGIPLIKRLIENDIDGSSVVKDYHLKKHQKFQLNIGDSLFIVDYMYIGDWRFKYHLFTREGGKRDLSHR